MGRYSVDFNEKARKQLGQLKKSGRKVDLARVARFTEEIEEHPRFGTGKPEQMRHMEVETWSRRVNDGDRFVYEVHEDEKAVFVTQVLGHYGDR